MMNAAVVEIMQRTNNSLPDAYDDPDRLAQLAQDVARLTGFENVAVPFCMTIEPELLGSTIDPGSLTCEAKTAQEAFPSVQNAVVPSLCRIPDGTRADRVVRAIERIASKDTDDVIVGSITGPVSTTASIVDPMKFLRELHTDREGCHRVLSKVVDVLFVFARCMVEAGANVIAISDPTATGEILGPRAFEGFALRYLNDLADRIHGLHVPAIVHICGNIDPVEHLVAQIRSDAVSTDAPVNLVRLKMTYSNIVTMGNVSTQMLQLGEPQRIAERTRQLVRDGVDIIAPACGLSTTTPLANIQAMTSAVKER